MTDIYEVRRMTCGHCIDAVTAAVNQLPGVTDIAVDLASGRVEVTSEATPDLNAVRAAVENAGFELVR